MTFRIPRLALLLLVAFSVVAAICERRVSWLDRAQSKFEAEIQARAASDALERAYWTCSKSGVPWLQATINAYAGRRCSDNWPGLQQRMATFDMLTHTATPVVGADS